MDPNATLRELRELLNEPQDGTTDSAVYTLDAAAGLFNGLDEWLSKGGFLPDEWIRPWQRPGPV